MPSRAVRADACLSSMDLRTWKVTASTLRFGWIHGPPISFSKNNNRANQFSSILEYNFEKRNLILSLACENATDIRNLFLHVFMATIVLGVLAL